MFKIKVSNKIIDYAKGLLEEHNFGKRGVADGSLAEQLTVMLKLIYEIEFASLQITSDAITSLYGANLGDPCVVIALGTGAVGARLNAQKQTKLVSGWGFTVDDFC